MRFKQAPAARGNVRIRLLNGRRLTANLNGPPPETLKITLPPEGTPIPGTKAAPGRTALCRRIDLEEYVEMGIEDLKKAGLLKGSDEKGDDLDKRPSLLV